MARSNINLRRATVLKLEQEVIDFHRTKKSTGHIVEAIRQGAEAPEGRQTNIAMARLLQAMRKTTEAIEQAYRELPEERQKWIRYRYWQTPKMNNEEAARKANITDRQARRWRGQFLSRLAELLGEW